jgi:lipoate synthase
MKPAATQEKQTAELPEWVRVPAQKQREMIQILSEMICRRMKQEVCNEPQQDS